MSISRGSATFILLSALTLATAFLSNCGKKEKPAVIPVPPVTSLTFPIPRLQGLSLNDRPIEAIAAQSQDPQNLEMQDLEKAFGISNPKYLDSVMQLIDKQLKSGNPLKTTSIYFGGAPQALATHCTQVMAQGICLIEPYAFNCSEALQAQNWSEENYLKLCRRLGRLKTYRNDRLVSVFVGDASLAAEIKRPAQPSPVSDRNKKTEAEYSDTSGSTQKPYPEMVELIRYLQREGILVLALTTTAPSALQSWGLAIPPERIGNIGPLEIERLLEREVLARNQRATAPQDKVNLDDLRLVLLASADFAALQPSAVPFLENASSVPGGGDLLFLHPHERQADKSLSVDPQPARAFQNFFNHQAELRPNHLGQGLEQAVVTQAAPGTESGFLKITPTNVQKSETPPVVTPVPTLSTPAPEAVVGATPAPAVPLQPIAPAPPADPRKDALE